MTLKQLRTAAVNQTLFAPTSLRAAIRRLGFVQADPIRAPARAQDLILRHRVKGYVAGDLERRYARLDIDEDVLYAYGFVARETLPLLHPKTDGKLSAFEADVLAAVREHGPLHPNDLRQWFGSERVVNDWGGYSKATKRALERLHKHGVVRVARRDAGVRVYEATTSPPAAAALSPNERMRALIRLVVTSLSPIPERTLSGIAAFVGRPVAHAVNHRSAIRKLIDEGELVREQVEGLSYVMLPARRSSAEPTAVRVLAPFDPVVWDRRRFEHLWGWAYRFEAYTPVAKRLRGYYALPLLWRSSVVGWANVSASSSSFDPEFGFVDRRPAGRDFERELEAELERLRSFLQPDREERPPARARRTG